MALPILSHGTGGSRLALTTRLHPVVSGALSATMLSILNLSSTLCGTQEEVCSPLKFNRGHLGTIPFLKPCPV